MGSIEGTVRVMWGLQEKVKRAATAGPMARALPRPTVLPGRPIARTTVSIGGAGEEARGGSGAVSGNGALGGRKESCVYDTTALDPTALDPTALQMTGFLEKKGNMVPSWHRYYK
jgi:hypothetical protein